MSATAEKNGHVVSSSSETQSALRHELPEVAPAHLWATDYPDSLHRAYRAVANHVYRGLGRFAYTAFDHVNATYFEGKLPETLLLWDLTEHGHALGWCRSPHDGPPIIKLHPALVSPADTQWRRILRDLATVWNYPLSWFGLAFAFDVLLHEC